MYMVSIDDKQCTGCGECAEACPVNLLSLTGEKAEVTGDATECLGCESCVAVCPSGAVTVREL